LIVALWEVLELIAILGHEQTGSTCEAFRSDAKREILSPSAIAQIDLVDASIEAGDQ
jgi:hypothetical protein